MKLGLLSRIASACLVVVAACAPPRPRPPQAFSFHVSSDPNKPLAGARILRDGRLLATSDDGGGASFEMDGHEGETFDVTVECPPGFQSPARPTTVMMRRLALPGAVAEYDAACRPKTRTIVVAVKGAKGHRLPVLQLGQEIARTDATGVATVLLRLGPEEPFDLALDTSAPDDAALRPQSPAATFLVKNRDDVLVFDPHFTEAKKPARRAPRAPGPIKGPAMPVRIQ
jgi:hypothetical protein